MTAPPVCRWCNYRLCRCPKERSDVKVEGCSCGAWAKFQAWKGSALHAKSCPWR